MLQRKLQPQCVVESVSCSQRAGIHLPQDGNELCANKNLSVLDLVRREVLWAFQQLKKTKSCPDKYKRGPAHQQNTFCNVSWKRERHRGLVKCPIIRFIRWGGIMFCFATSQGVFMSWISMWMSVKKKKNNKQQFVLDMGNPAEIHHWSSQQMKPGDGFDQTSQNSCPCTQDDPTDFPSPLIPTDSTWQWHTKKRSPKKSCWKMWQSCEKRKGWLRAPEVWEPWEDLVPCANLQLLPSPESQN